MSSSSNSNTNTSNTSNSSNNNSNSITNKIPIHIEIEVNNNSKRKKADILSSVYDKLMSSVSVYTNGTIDITETDVVIIKCDIGYHLH